MQPESPIPSPGAEREQHPSSPEQYALQPVPEIHHLQPEAQEKTEIETSRGDRASGAPLTLPEPPLKDQSASIVVPALVDNTPLIAADQDLIEEVWVNKAKKIVKETRSDPYQQESQVARLQVDYQKKRFGKEIKLASDQ